MENHPEASAKITPKCGPSTSHTPLQNITNISSGKNKKGDKLPIELPGNIPEQYRAAVTEKCLKMHNYSLERGDKPWTLKEFEIGTPLSQGKFGRVYLARDRVCHTHVAIKVIFQSQIEKEKMHHQIIREIEIQSRLNHPNIITLLAYFSDKKHVYLVMEYAANGDLFNHLQNSPLKRFPENISAKYTYQVADALHYCHQNKVIHRDIKPENLLLGLDGNVKLSDFGWSVHAPSLKRRTICGTMDYLSPEMIQNQEYNEFVDNWCLGVLCYELLVGNTPFESKDKGEIYRKIDAVTYTFPDFVCEGSRDLISKLLKKNPVDRLPLPDVMKHEWIVSKMNNNG